MSQWTLNSPPKHAPNAEATEKGWCDPDTGEVLVAIRNLSTKAGGADIVSVSITNLSTLAQGSNLAVRVKYNEKVTVDAGATLVLTFTGAAGDITLYAVAQTGVSTVVFAKLANLSTNATVPVSAAATGTLTLTGNAANGETVTLGAKTYTFQDTLTNVNGNVKIGADASATLDNLIAAINLAAGAGTTYAAATTLHPTVSALAGTGDTMVVTAKTGGTAGNALASTTTIEDGSFGDTTLDGGTDNSGTLSLGAQTITGTIVDTVAGTTSSKVISAPQATAVGTKAIA